jgi:hypothetical protein
VDDSQILKEAIAARSSVFATCEGARRRFRPYAIGYCGRGLKPSVYVYQFADAGTNSAWRCIPVADFQSVVHADELHDPPEFPAVVSGRFDLLDGDLCLTAEAA